MTEPTTPRRETSRRGSWALCALLGVAVVVDVIDGAPLKLATSVLLFAACLLVALSDLRAGVSPAPLSSPVPAVRCCCFCTG